MGKIELDHTGSGGGVTLSSDGTDLLLDGTAIGGGGGSLDLFAENYDGTSTTPNATGTNAFAIGVQSTSSATNSVAIGTGAYVTHQGGVGLGYSPTVTANYGVAIGANSAGAGAKVSGAGGVALGGSNTQGSEAFSAVIDNTTTSYGASGTNSVAIGYRAKATAIYSSSLGGFENISSGTYSVTAGSRNTASATRSIAIGGHSNEASGNYSAILGGIGNTASGNYSRAGGFYADTQNIDGKDAYASYSFFNDGDQQRASLVLFCDTTDATAEALRSNTSAAGTTNQVILPNNSAYAFHGTIVARQKAGDGTASAAWKVEGLIRREGSAGTTVLVNSATTVLDNTPSWGLALSADTTNGGLKIEATGAASTNIRWVATIHTSEVTYA